MRIKYLIPFILLLIALPAHAAVFTLRGATSTRATAQVWRGATAADYDFSVSSNIARTYISGGSTTTNTVNDAVIQTYAGATYDNGASIITTLVTGATLFPSYTSLDPTIGTVDQNGIVTRIGTGAARINVSAGNEPLIKRIVVNVSRTTEPTVMTLSSYVSGSLAKDISDETDALIAGKTFSTTTTYIFSTQNLSTHTYVRNVNNILIAAGIDTTMIAAANSNNPNLGVAKAGVLISPRDILLADHLSYGVGTVVDFVKSDNTTYQGTVSAYGMVGTDIGIAHLSADVPAGISFAKILPSNWATYLPSISNILRVPFIGFVGGAFDGTHPVRQSFIGEAIALSGNTGLTVPISTPRSNFYVKPVGGDSGNPAFFLINGKLVLLSAWHTDSAGPFTSSNIAGINSLMTSLGSTYQLSTTSLAGFNTY